MTSGISNKFLRQTFQRNFIRFLPVHKHVNKTSSAYHTVCFHRQNEKTRRDYNSFVHNRSWKTVSHASMPLCMNFQVRNISNETSGPKNNEQSLDVSSDILSNEANEAVSNLMTNIPSIFRNMSDWKIVEYAQHTLLYIHETTGLPWWASIALTAFLARALVTLPFSIYTVRNTAKLEMINEEMDDIVKEKQKIANYNVSQRGWPEKLARREYERSILKEIRELRVEENCHPAKNSILILVQMPLWFAFSIATRNLCYMLPEPDIAAQITFVEMSVGGLAWFSNLVVPDPTLILPIAMCVTNLAVLEVHRLFRPLPPTKVSWFVTNFFRLLSVLMAVVSSYLPAATNVYWLTSSTFGLLQAFILQSKKLRRSCGVPIVKTEHEHPYRYFYNNLKSKL